MRVERGLRPAPGSVAIAPARHSVHGDGGSVECGRASTDSDACRVALPLSPLQPIDVLCIGSVLWDVIGRTSVPMAAGDDRPGHIVRQPGGVALNVAMALRILGLRPALLSALGQDSDGAALVLACQRLGLNTDYLYQSIDLSTDFYMAIEGQGKLIAAIADAHTLEAAGHKILQPLSDGRLARATAPWTVPIVLDGNLTEGVLHEIAHDPLYAKAQLLWPPQVQEKPSGSSHFWRMGKRFSM